MVKFDHGFVGPQAEANLCPGYKLTWVFEQKKQNAEWLLGEPPSDAALAQFAGTHV
jgi:hypothetical protein